jgi:hypothetical protein
MSDKFVETNCMTTRNATIDTAINRPHDRRDDEQEEVEEEVVDETSPSAAAFFFFPWGATISVNIGNKECHRLKIRSVRTY